MIATQIYSELVMLRNQAGERLYYRLKLADQLLQDKGWVGDPAGGGGDDGRALDRLEEDCFGDLCGVLSLPQLLEVFHHIPDEVKWKKNKYNLKKMYDVMKAKTKVERQPRELTPNDEVIRDLRRENAELKARVHQLEQDNHKLRKAVKRLLDSAHLAEEVLT